MKNFEKMCYMFELFIIIMNFETLGQHSVDAFGDRVPKTGAIHRRSGNLLSSRTPHTHKTKKLFNKTQM